MGSFSVLVPGAAIVNEPPLLLVLKRLLMHATEEKTVIEPAGEAESESTIFFGWLMVPLAAATAKGPLPFPEAIFLALASGAATMNTATATAIAIAGRPITWQIVRSALQEREAAIASRSEGAVSCA